MDSEAVLTVDLPGFPHVRRGKVREVFDAGDHLLIVATDRISAFDCIMPNGIPGKGKILTEMSRFWFDKFSGLVENHLVSTDMGEISDLTGRSMPRPEILEGRSMLVRRAEPLTIECVARGYLAGSGWKDYRETGSICGIHLPDGLKESERLPEIIFTPATKAESGHDLNISSEEAAGMVGETVFDFVRETTLTLYRSAAEYAEEKGIIISDTKFEFGLYDDRIILIDEALTPDSSRFWPMDEYEPGRPQKSFDKQFVRDYLETTGWDKTPPAPKLPEEIVRKTAEKYREARTILMGS
jgi:phosphoribosylaminoimidazole-succinocarboxamide synthase